MSHGNRKDYKDKLSDLLSTECLKAKLLAQHTVQIDDKKVVLDSIIFSENIEAGWCTDKSKMQEFKALKFRTNLFIKSVFEFIEREVGPFLSEQE